MRHSSEHSIKHLVLSSKVTSAPREEVDAYNASEQQPKLHSYEKANNNFCIVASPNAAHNRDVQRCGSQNEVEALGEWQQQGSNMQKQPLSA
jgi:hypothetical protein